MATILENTQRIKAAADDIREVIDLCYAPVGEDERIETYAPKLAKLAVDEPTLQNIGVGGRTTADGVAIKDGIAVVDKVYGETRKINQIITSIGTRIGLHKLDERNWQYIPTDTSNLSIIVNFIQKENRKYLCHYYIKGDNIRVGNIGSFTSDENYYKGRGNNQNGVWMENIYIYTAKLNWEFAYIYCTYAITNIGDSCYFKDIAIFDLTDIYGSGNEPTTADQFCQDYFGKNAAYVTDDEWASIGEYNKGSLVSACPKEIVSESRTVMWNQFNYLSCNNTTGWQKYQGDGSIEIRDGYITLYCETANTANRISANIGNKFIAGHKVFCASKIKTDRNLTIIGEINSDWVKIFPEQTFSGSRLIASIFENIQTRGRFQIGFWGVGSISIMMLLFVDLTKMFGEGNEPSTPDEFTKLRFGKDINDVTDEEWESISAFNEGELQDIHGNEPFVSRLPLDPTTILDENGEQVFPNGLLSAGNVYDEIDLERGVAVKRIGSADLGSVGWFYDSNRLRASCTFNDIASCSNNKEANIICAKYRTISANTHDITRDVDMTIRGSTTNSVFVRNLSCSTGDEIKKANQGVIVYYELAEPKEYPLHASFRKQFYRVGNGGTERITADGVTLPLKADIAYRMADAAAMAADMANAQNIL